MAEKDSKDYLIDLSYRELEMILQGLYRSMEGFEKVIISNYKIGSKTPASQLRKEHEELVSKIKDIMYQKKVG